MEFVFKARKERVMAALKDGRERDKSPKGSLDAPICTLIEAINRHPSYFTTSSCSGRISVFLHPSTDVDDASASASASFTAQVSSGEGGICTDEERKTTKKKKKKAAGGSWLFVSHEQADPETLVDLVFGEEIHARLLPKTATAVFRFEPFILSVDCIDVAAAQVLVSTAISCGFRESGITSMQKRVIVAIRCSIRLEVPLGQWGLILVSKDYLRYLVEVANSKMEANRRRTDAFTHILETQLLVESKLVKPVSNNKEENLMLKSVLDTNAVQQSKLLKQRSSIVQDLASKQNFGHSDSVEGSCNVDLGEGACLEDQAKITYCGIDSDSVHQEQVGTCDGKITNLPFAFGTTGALECSLSIFMLNIVGQPVQKLFLWGHSACKLNSFEPKGIFIFGGFGGLGQHARRSYLLKLDPTSGLLNEINASCSPSPRVGHTMSVVGDDIFVIGGRGDPTQIFNDVWHLKIAEKRWELLECTGTKFYSRHRHAAAVVGTTIFVFGGISNEVMYSSMMALNTEALEWSEVSLQGELPGARHSHSIVAFGSKLFMFGGYDGYRPLGDLFSFDSRSYHWMKEKTTGKPPSPRFSHSMFIYKDFIGILGGCPVSQHNEELFLLNLHHNVWMHVRVHSIGREILIRTSVTVVQDDLIIIGGGSSCYAFGTKFNLPTKINLKPLDSTNCVCSDEATIIDGNTLMKEKESRCSTSSFNSSEESPVSYRTNCFVNARGQCSDSKGLVLKVEKKYARLVKELMKKLGWLDLQRKIKPTEDRHHVLIPVDQEFPSILEKYHDTNAGKFDQECYIAAGVSADEISLPRACSFLSSHGCLLLSEAVDCSRKVTYSPKVVMKEFVSSLLCKKGLPLQLLDELPTRWERLGNIVVFPVSSFNNPMWNNIKSELWPLIAKSLCAERLALQGRVLPAGTRDSTLEILWGDDSWVIHHENGICYSFDATKCMFSKGNFSEKLRMAHLDCSNEVIVDLFAGIGYFTLPFLVKANAKLVYACEWNPHALMALRQNVRSNGAEDRCIILEGDNLDTAPKKIADRICLGLLPSSERSWLTAVQALRSEGGVLHVHGTADDSKEEVWLEHVEKSIMNMAQLEGLSWDVSIEHVERVKWYGPRVRHLVADVRCREIHR